MTIKFPGKPVHLFSSTLIAFLTAFTTLIQSSATAQAPRVAVVNAANFTQHVAAGSIAAAFGNGLATTTEACSSLPLPTTLGGARVEIGGYLAGLFFVSPYQINFHVPADLEAGLHQVRVSNTAGTLFLGEVFVNLRAPGVFTIHRNGQGRAVTYSIPAGEISYIVFFGTGFGDAFTHDTYLHIAGLGSFEAQYVGPAPGFAGLDQVNVPIPAGAIAGEVGAVFTSGGYQSQGFLIR